MNIKENRLKNLQSTKKMRKSGKMERFHRISKKSHTRKMSSRLEAIGMRSYQASRLWMRLSTKAMYQLRNWNRNLISQNS